MVFFVSIYTQGFKKLCGKKKEFCHAYFLKDHPEKLKFIKRKADQRRKRARASPVPSGDSASCSESRSVNSQIAMVRLDIQHLREDLDALKQQLFCMESMRSDQVKHRASRDLMDRMEAKACQTVGGAMPFKQLFSSVNFPPDFRALYLRTQESLFSSFAFDNPPDCDEFEPIALI